VSLINLLWLALIVLVVVRLAKIVLGVPRRRTPQDRNEAQRFDSRDKDIADGEFKELK
jgi:hypothetical protein